jgi:hypothetical protein
VCGGIQPDILKRHLNSERRESGLAARLLLAYPPQKNKVWTDAEVDSTTEALLENVANRLFSLDFQRDAEGRTEPVCIGMSHEAKQLFIAYYNRHAQEQAELTGDMAAAWSKLEEYAARIALVLHYVRWSVNDFNLANENQVDATTMQAAITITEWFKHEAKRVYTMFSESDEDRELRRLAEWIARKGGRITARDLQRGPREYREDGAAEDALEKLVQAGYGHWQPLPSTSQGGRTSRIFVLSNVTTGDTT